MTDNARAPKKPKPRTDVASLIQELFKHPERFGLARGGAHLAEADLDTRTGEAWKESYPDGQ